MSAVANVCGRLQTNKPQYRQTHGIEPLQTHPHVHHQCQQNKDTWELNATTVIFLLSLWRDIYIYICHRNYGMSQNILVIFT